MGQRPGLDRRRRERQELIAAAARLRHSPWLLATVVVALPLLWWAFRLATGGWAPEGDGAVAAIKTHDAFSRHLQLLGMPSTSGLEVHGTELMHLGPILFQWGWPFYALSGWAPWGLLLGSALLMVVLAAVGLAAAETAAGRPAAVALAATFLLCEVALRGLLVTPWNPYPMLFGLPALAAVGGAILAGSPRWWVAFALVGSIVAQAHLFGAVLVAAVAVIVGVLAVSRRVGLPSLRVAMAMVAVLAVSWWAPVLDVLAREPDNLDQLYGYVVGDREPTSRMLQDWFTVAVLGVGGAAMVRRAHQRRSRSAVESILGWALLTMAAIVLAFPSRQMYLLFALGIALLAAALVVQQRVQWSPSGRSWWVGGLVWAGFVVMVPPVFSSQAALTEATAATTSRTRDFLRTAGTEAPVWVVGFGPLSWASVAPGVQAALVADGRFAGRQLTVADPDQEFRQQILREPHLIVVVRDLTPTEFKWEPAPGVRVISRERIATQVYGGAELELVLAQSP